MYNALIKELRDCRNKAVLSEYWWDITSRAADAIEELINENEKPTYEALSSEIEAVVKFDRPSLTLTEDEAYSIANHIDFTLIEAIRNDTDIDSLTWLRNLIHGYEKLCQYSGYVGVTEKGNDYTTK